MAEDEKSKGRFNIRKIKEIVKPNKSQEPLEVKAVEDVVEGEVVEAEVLEEQQDVTPPPDWENPEEKKGFFSQFPKIYWVANTLELFERGAYYGVLAVLSVHILLLGIDNVTKGSLLSMLLFFSYFWPLIASALAEKFGYKQMILTSFLFLITGYFFMSTIRIGQLPLIVIALLLIGFGAGTFKPLISATIAHATKDHQRNLAYSLYYWFINFGAFIFPLILGFAFPTPETWYFIFIVSGILITINMGIAFFIFQNPVEPQRDLSVSQAFKKILPALQDKKFRALIIIYAGFWFMYAVNHSFLPQYMLEFRRMPLWFTLQFLAVINPGTIILVGPALGKFLEKYKSLNVMMVGIVIYCIGVLITFSSNSPELFVTGIVVFSIGEFVTHPGFISYVSKIAPKDKVAIYMGAIFISTGTGIVLGPIIMSFWYEYFVVSLNMPKLFGAAIVSVGMLTFGCFILYNRWINKLAKEEDPTYEEDKSIWVKLASAMVAFTFIPILIGVGYAGGTDIFYGVFENGDTGPTLPDWENDYDLISVQNNPITGTSTENTPTEKQEAIAEENINTITFTLTWTDEAAGTGFENDPDEFTLEVESPNGESDSDGPSFNSPGGQGSLSVSFSFSSDKDPFEDGTGTYNVTIICGDCGDQHGPFGFITQPDNGNNWELLIEYNYYQEKEE